MPSPFPGMNPYLERPDVWNDFHDSFIPALRAALVPQIRPRYYACIEENLYIHEPTAKERFPINRSRIAMPVIVEEERFPYLEIRDRDKREVVTVIELLSPANKTDGRDQYLAKVQRVLASKANFVEIDLLRAHAKMPWDRLPACDYYALVSRYADRQGRDPRADFWPLGIRDPLPTIPIPLRPGEVEPTVDLQAILNHVYDEADYGMFLYEFDPEPRLSVADAAWAAQLLHPPGAPA